MSRLFRTDTLPLWVLLFAGVAPAQQAILGTVTDASGAAVPGAAVVAINAGTNATFRAVTNGQGYYTVPTIPVGRYSVEAEAAGFKKTARSGITIQVEKRAQVDLVRAVQEDSHVAAVVAGIAAALLKSWVLEGTYTANHGTRLVSGAYDYNQMDPKYYSLGLALQDQADNPYVGKVPGNLGGAKITRQQSLRPFPYIATISVRAPHQGNSSYNAFQASVNKKMSHGVSLMLSYTTGKLMSDSVQIPLNWFGEQANVTGYQNGKYARSAERSLDPTDVSQRMVVSGLFELPFGRRKPIHPSNKVVSKIVGGWQLNTISTMQTGVPLMVTGANNNLANRPNSTGKSPALENQTLNHWFNAQAFVNPPVYTYGNLGRTLPDVRAPGVINIDASLLKDWVIREGIKLQFRAEGFNMPNHVNYGFPNTGFTAARDGGNGNTNAGKITSARSSRNGQLGLKLIF